MRRIELIFSIAVVSASLLTSCADQGSGNAGNKPTNAAASTNTAASSAAAESEIRKLMDTGAAALARNDADTMEKIYSDGYMLVNNDGSVQTRAERLSALRSGAVKYTSFAYDDSNIRVSPEGTGAVVITRVTMTGTGGGKALDGSYRVMQVYSKTPAGWRQVSAQATAITNAAPANGLPTPSDAAAGLPTPAKPTGGLPTPGAGATANTNK